jgi:SAM-dependent methyltransferase
MNVSGLKDQLVATDAISGHRRSAGLLRSPQLRNAVYVTTIFIAAFLLFQVQPVVAKMILPRFGGSSAVWAVCMLFFQAGLLLGYLYAHWLHQRFSARRQAIIHSLLLAASLLVLPLAPGASWMSGTNPSLDILRLLSFSAGLPYFMLATTSPMLQSWYARSGAVPYRLFALSNLASLAALLSYPVLVEPNLTTLAQGRLWSIAYACFALLCAVAAAMNALQRRNRAGTASAARIGETPPPDSEVRSLWVALPACSSILLLAMTNHLTQDVAAIPFLWIVPLAAYLLSFIACFEAPRLYVRGVFYPLLCIALAGMGYMLWPVRQPMHVIASVAISAAALFVFSMVCHGELARLKPDPRYLTSYYLMLSAGGALGGLFVGLIAPSLFDADYELPLGLVLCAALASWMLVSGHRLFFSRRLGAICQAAFLAVLGVYILYLAVSVRGPLVNCRVAARNFYGQLRVCDIDNGDGAGVRRRLVHGVIKHGEQFMEGAHRGKPYSYYCAETGVGRAILLTKTESGRRFGVIGLGAGTLAAYGQPGDVFRFYELNPLIMQLARTEFTYLRDTPAHVELVLGDGRLSLEREPDQHFDLLVIDAFSGDAIPVHLLTREAFRTYFRHLKPDGILAVHISNRYLDLRPVIESNAAELGKTAVAEDYKPRDGDPLCLPAQWVLVMSSGAATALGPGLGDVAARRPIGFRPWTDDFSDMLRILK